MRKGLMPSRIVAQCISGLPRYTSVRFLAFLPQVAQHVAFTHQIELFCIRGSKEIKSSTEKHSSIASLVIEHAVAEQQIDEFADRRGGRPDLCSNLVRPYRLAFYMQELKRL